MSQSAAGAVIVPGENAGSITDRVCAVALGQRPDRWWLVALVPSFLLLAWGLVAVAWTFWRGIQVWGNDWPNVWGFPILCYVWWIGIASGGTFVSAFFYLLQAEWRTSVNRIAETMTLFAAICAGIYPILHLGRPWFFYWLFPYPNTMGLWPQFKSPLMWDFIAILAYVISSFLFWYMGLLPDLASVRDRARNRTQQILYGIAALGFRGSGRQWRHFRAAYAIMAAIMAPMVCSVHSVVGLDFAGGEMPGWHSTMYPPFFVCGAVLSGFAFVLMLIIPLRRLAGLEAYITGRHIDVLARLTLLASLTMSYWYGMDAFSAFYGHDPAERTMFIERITGFDSSVFWATILLNCLVPLLLLCPAVRRRAVLVFVISGCTVVGMWLERYSLVIQIPHRNRIASAWGDFHPTFWDWSLFAGTCGLFLTGFLLCIRVVPMVSMFEMRELVGRRGAA